MTMFLWEDEIIFKYLKMIKIKSLNFDESWKFKMKNVEILYLLHYIIVVSNTPASNEHNYKVQTKEINLLPNYL